MTKHRRNGDNQSPNAHKLVGDGFYILKALENALKGLANRDF
jgi:hypothetical protein